jgi:uncharacterized protein YkwD
MRMRATLPVTGATPATPAHRRRLLIVAVAMIGALVLSVVEAPVADAGYQRKMLRIVNRTRARHDLRLLRLDRELSRDSMPHTRKMIRRDRIFDPPNLADILAPYKWDDLGADVVGCGHTLRELHRILMTEAYHRAILLHSKLRRVGIAVIQNNRDNRCGRGSLWATEIFYG